MKNKSPSIAYKIVREFRGELMSYGIVRTLKYKIGEVTIPVIGKIFAFKEKEDAVKFLKATAGEQFIILMGYAENLKRINFISINYDDDELFWKLYKNKKRIAKTINVGPVIKGTYVCDSFTPTEIVLWKKGV